MRLLLNHVKTWKNFLWRARKVRKRQLKGFTNQTRALLCRLSLLTSPLGTTAVFGLPPKPNAAKVHSNVQSESKTPADYTGQMATCCSWRTFPTTPPSHARTLETTFLWLTQMVDGVIVHFEAHYHNTFSIFRMVCTCVSHIERWIREMFLSSD